MKNLLPLSVCSLLLFGCDKKYDDSELKRRLENLENTRIPSIESQIAAIQTTLPLLQQTDTEIKGYITTLQDKVNALGQAIAVVNTKIQSLETEFSQDLSDITSQLNSYKQEIQNKIDSFSSSIKALQIADAELEKKISLLDGKIDTQKDWVTTTFTTLTQYNELVADIATIRTNMETINKNIADLEKRLNEKIDTDIATAVTNLQEEIQQKVTEITNTYTTALQTAKAEITDAYTSAISYAIEECITSMKDWINKELTNYYDIATIDAKMQLLQNTIKSGDTTLDEKLQNELTIVNKSIETTKAELTIAYEDAIKKAIEINNGIINNKISHEITTINKRIDTEVQALTARIAAIEVRLSALENKVDDIGTNVAALLKRIQSVSYIPRYNDNQATMKKEMGTDKGIASFDFMISPKDAADELAEVWSEAVTMKAVYTQTRAVSFIELPIVNFNTDSETGIITLTVSGENLSDDFYLSATTASAALFISDGNNSIVSDYIPMIANISCDYIFTYTTNDGKPIQPTNIPQEEEENANVFWEKVIINSCSNEGEGKLILRSDDLLSIEAYAFYECTNLTSITIPDNVTLIKDWVFAHCTNLTDITIPDSVTSIEHAAFMNCTNLNNITIPDSVTLIKDWVFAYCTNLTDITIPKNVRSIGECAFFRCKNLTSVSIPDSVSLIQDYAFYDCINLHQIHISDITKWCEIVYENPYATPLYYASDLYLNGELVTDLVIPEGATWINEYAFYNYKNLNSVSIPNSISGITGEAFAGCTNLTRISITDIAKWCAIAFSATSKSDGINPLIYAHDLYLNGNLVTDLIIPQGVTRINPMVFSGCTSLTSVTIPNSVTSIGKNAFSECSNLTHVYITDIAKWCTIAFENQDANPLRIDDNTYNMLYLNGNPITNLVLPEGIPSIALGAFRNCSSLTSISIPNSVTSIGSAAFYNCPNLTSISIPNSVTSIGEFAFTYCTNLTNIAISNNISTIETAVFGACTSLTSITIPDSVTSIGDCAFCQCTSLTSFYCKLQNPPTIGYNMLTDCPSSLKIYVPHTSIEAYKTTWAQYANRIVGYDF